MVSKTPVRCVFPRRTRTVATREMTVQHSAAMVNCFRRRMGTLCIWDCLEPRGWDLSKDILIKDTAKKSGIETTLLSIYT